MARKIPRRFLIAGSVAVVSLVLLYAFWPSATMIDMGVVSNERMRVTIDEEGRTRIRDTYIVSTPIAGRLLRVAVEPGDTVVRDDSVVARMLPDNPVALDARARQQAITGVAAAEAGLRLARADRERALADKDLADAELERLRQMQAGVTVSVSALDRARREARAAKAELDTARASIAMREAQLASARAQLSAGEDTSPGGNDAPVASIPIRAPADGIVLKVMQESATTLPAGTPLMEIGDIEHELEVLVELLSTDAVQVAPGDRVIIEDWGGDTPLDGSILRIYPQGFTKVSALGVEEQRVQTIVRFDAMAASRAGRIRLGTGFRVEARIVVWEQDDALVVPSSALFRTGKDWAVFVVEEGVARLRTIEVGRNNGTQAEVRDGLEAGARVVLYPSTDLSDGTRVEQRKTG